MTKTLCILATVALGLGGTPVAQAATKGPIERKVDPEEAKRKAEAAKLAAEKAAAEKVAAEKAAVEKAAEDAKKAEEAKAAADKEAAEKKKQEEEEAAATAAKAAEPPKGTPTWAFMLAPDSQPEHVLLMQGSLGKGVATNDKLHLVDSDISALPADLQTALNEGCRVTACRTALLAAIKVPQALVVEMNSSGSSLTFTLFSSSGDTLGRSSGNCIGCLEDAAKRDLVITEMVQDLYIKPAAKTLAEANAAPAKTGKGGSTVGPLVRGRQKRLAPKRKGPEIKAWSPSVWTYAGAGGLVVTGVAGLVAAAGAHSTYVAAINEERGPGEIQGIADAGAAREALAYTSFVLSAGVVVASYVLEQEVKR